jgi:hypothetical protein
MRDRQPANLHSLHALRRAHVRADVQMDEVLAHADATRPGFPGRKKSRDSWPRDLPRVANSGTGIFGVTNHQEARMLKKTRWCVFGVFISLISTMTLTNAFIKCTKKRHEITMKADFFYELTYSW